VDSGRRVRGSTLRIKEGEVKKPYSSSLSLREDWTVGEGNTTKKQFLLGVSLSPLGS